MRTHKIALDPTDKQRTYLAKCAGVSRFTYNWALSEWNKMYDAWKEDKSLKKPNQQFLRRELNAIKREQFPWMFEVTKCAPQEAIIDLGKAFNNFFKRRTNHPVYKKKGVNDSFRVSSGFFKVSGKTIRLPIIGSIRMREELRYEGVKQVSVTISRRADRWYASVVCEAELHARISDIRADFLHKMTTDIVSGADTIVIEDLDVKGMLRNKYVSKGITDASFGEFKRQLGYKTEAANKTLIIADRYYPSSKLCSACGAKNKHLILNIRNWICEECGTPHDRDLNAAINLKKYADSSAVSVRGEFFASTIPRLCENMVSYLCEAETKQQLASWAFLYRF